MSQPVCRALALCWPTHPQAGREGAFRHPHSPPSLLSPVQRCTAQGHGGPAADWAGTSQDPAGNRTVPGPPFGASPVLQYTLYLCVHTHPRTQMHTCASASAGSAGVMRSRHLPARCTPAVNQRLEGAAGEATPREVRAARGHLRFPKPLTVAAWNEPGACQPLGCLLPFPDGEPGLREGQGLSGGHTLVAAGAGLPAQPS